MPDWLSFPLPRLTQALRTEALALPEYIRWLEEGLAGRNPQVLAFLPESGRLERVLRGAETLRKRYPERGTRPSLYGAAVGVKDIFHVDGFPTHAGSHLPAEALAGDEADSVRQLREAGALVLGKTVTTEFAYFAPGPTRNPLNLEHTPGGSSSGSAAAVAAGLVPLALGTQTIGSVLRPASFCGVVGFKPSYGRVSARGVIPLAPSLDHVGWFTRDVSGTAAAAAVLCSAWTPSPTSRRPILGIPDGPYLARAGAEARGAVDAAVEALRREGYDVRRIGLLADFDEVVQHHRTILAAEAARVHSEWFRRYASLYHPKTVELIRDGQKIDEADLSAAQSGRRATREAVLAAMQAESIDVWVSAAAVGAAPRGLDSTGDPVMNLPWTHIGFPAIALPCGVDPSGLPLGLQLVAAPGADEALLAWAADIERLVSVGASAALNAQTAMGEAG